MGLLGGIILAVLIGQLLLLHMGDRLTRWSYDLPFLFTSQSVPQDLVMVYLDSKIKAQLGQTTDRPLDRRFYAANSAFRSFGASRTTSASARR